MAVRSILKELKVLEKFKIVSVIGSQWGDEGKGKIVDNIASRFNIVARFNGGSNAGHTIQLNDKKYSFHMLPCGMLYRNTINVIGNGVVLDYKSLERELDNLKKEGVHNEENLLISNRAHLVFDFHKAIDHNREMLMGNSEIGTTKKGIGPCYSLKSSRFGLRVGDLFGNFDDFKRKYEKMVSLVLKTDKCAKETECDLERLFDFTKRFKSNVMDTSLFLSNSLKEKKSILAEGANATMLDLDFGTYPFVTSSNTTNCGVFNGLGIPPTAIFSIGVVKAYTTRVGAGPFPTELVNEIGEEICQVGKEYGTTTGRKRRVGWLDIPVLSYSARLNGFSVINLTKLDVLSHLREIKIATKYKLNGKFLEPGEFPSTLEQLQQVTVEYETLPGWNCGIRGVEWFEDLPENARRYVRRVEELLGLPIRFIGVGTKRDSFVVK